MNAYVCNRKIGQCIRIDGASVVKFVKGDGKRTRVVVLTDTGTLITAMDSVPPEFLPSEVTNGEELPLAND